MSVPTAKEMADGLMSVFSILDRKDLIQNFEVVRSISRELKRYRNARTWSFSLGKGEPILFKNTKDDQGNIIIPQITVEILNVDGKKDFPFLSWNIALEVYFDTGGRLARWHFDLSNTTQDGPRLHMQYGGRFGDHKSEDIYLRVPRWHLPAMDLILLAEIVTANFYTKEWNKIRDNPNWCKYIHQSQELCVKPYFERMSKFMGVSSCTILNEMWCDKWT